MKIIRHWIVKAIFADGDFDSQEQEFINKIIKKYNLNEKIIRKLIKKEQHKLLNEKLDEWEKEDEMLQEQMN